MCICVYVYNTRHFPSFLFELPFFLTCEMGYDKNVIELV